MKKSEFNLVDEFSAKLGLKNQTDGSLFIAFSLQQVLART